MVSSIKKPLKVLALDFDGTLVESNKIKDQAFERIFSDWPSHREHMLSWHRLRNTIDRHEKFRYFVEEVLGESGNTHKIDILKRRFSVLTRQAIIHCPWVAGADEFLKAIRLKMPLYLISATPQKELNYITFHRGMKQFFKEIYGAPIDKVAVMQKIIECEKILPNEMLYIGDSPEDLESAQNLNVNFIGIDSGRGLNYQHLFTDYHQLFNFLNDQYF